MRKDVSLLRKGKSDPYAVINVGTQEYTTKVIENTVDPKWDYWCEVRRLFYTESLKSYYTNFGQFVYNLNIKSITNKDLPPKNNLSAKYNRSKIFLN